VIPFLFTQQLQIEIENEISKLKSGKATGPFSILVDILKLLKSVLFTPLKIPFNNTFLCGIVLSDLKLANVIPVCLKTPKPACQIITPSHCSQFFTNELRDLCVIDLLVF